MGLENVFHSNHKEGQCQRLFTPQHNCARFTFYQGNAQVLQARLQQYVNQEFADLRAVFRKGIGARDEIANICWIKGIRN